MDSLLSPISIGAEASSLIDKFIWNAVHSSPSTMTTYAAMALMLKGLLLGVVLVNVCRFYILFYNVDGPLVHAGIALGTMSSIAQTGLNAHQVRQLILHAGTDYAGIARQDAWETLAVTFITAHFNAAATSFYSWRAWKLSGQKKASIPIFLCGIIASYALVFPMFIYGAKMPSINIEHAGKLQNWLLTQAKLIKAWGVTSVGVDIAICSLLVWLFLKKQESMFHAERALLNRLLILVFETMIPPTVVMLILVCWTSTTGSTMTDFWRILVWTLPDLYFLSVLHSLISRRTIKTMLDNRQLSDGVKFVNNQPIYSSTSRTRVANETACTSGVLSDTESVKVEVNTLISESHELPMFSPDRQTLKQHSPFSGLPRVDEYAESWGKPDASPKGAVASHDQKRQSRRKPAPAIDPYWWPGER